jgi:SRSO17 transposase
MTERLPAAPAPGPLEAFAQTFDDLFAKRSQREGFRRYLEGLLLPMERNKTLTGLANTEPVNGAQHPQAQQLQWFLSESNWSSVAVNQRRLELLLGASQTVPHGQGALLIDETGDRKWGRKTAHVGRQYLSNVGKVDNGVVSVQTVWADERRYYPLTVEPYTPASWFEGGKHHANFRTKPQIALELVEAAVAAGVAFRAVVADSFYGENDNLRQELMEREVGYVLALRPSHSWWHAADQPGALWELAQATPWTAQAPGDWQTVQRGFRDGHEETWWALEAVGAPYGPDKAERAVVVTTNPATLPDETTWYLVTNLPAPGRPRARRIRLPPADLAEIVRLYGLRVWVEQSYKQVKQHLGWAQYQVRSDPAIRRHWELVCCAFCFCWWALAHDSQPLACDPTQQADDTPAPPTATGQGEKSTTHSGSGSAHDHLAARPAAGARLVGAIPGAAPLVASLVAQTATAPAPGAVGLAGTGERHLSLCPVTTNYC